MSDEDIKSKFSLPKRYRESGNTVWSEYAKLSSDYKPINLGTGFPDFPPPRYVKDALLEVANNSSTSIHQCTKEYGHPRLLEILGKMYSKLLDRAIDSNNEMIVTLSATNALFDVIMAIVDDGDEVIIMEPFFDYEHFVKIAGGVSRFIPLKLQNTKPDEIPSSADWIFDHAEFAQLFNPKTKALILNTPHNPTGKVFSKRELIQIADLCKRWNVMCISDEVYEWLVYGPCAHIRIASLPGMWERTITIGSAGKSFGVTGWRLGWTYGASHLMKNVQIVHHNSVGAGNTILQEAVAICLEIEYSNMGQDSSYFKTMSKDLEQKRDFMVGVLKEIGMKPTRPDGGYFILADWTQLESKVDLSDETDRFKDYRFTKWLTKNVGVQGIPNSAFYTESHKTFGESYVRFCFVKCDDNLQKAAERLRRWNVSHLQQ